MSNDGRVKHPLYTTWLTMKDRCNNPRNRHFHNYGGRGIKVCDRWSKNGGSGFWAFVEDMGARPDGYTLDRINNNMGYSPDNCRWASKIEQNLNKRTNRKTPYISTRVRSGRTQYVVRVKDTRDKTGRTVHTKVRNTLDEAIAARDILIEQMTNEGARG